MLGKLMLRFLDQLGGAAQMAGSAIVWSFKARIEYSQTLAQCVKIGVNSLPVTMLTSCFTGMVLALQTGSTMKNIFNEPLFLGSIVSFALVKELSPVLTAYVIAGRAGAAITAEIGTMEVTDQIDALYTLGTNPIRFLVIPRYIACLIMVPLLTVFADFCGVLGGFFVAALRLDVANQTFYDEIFTYMRVTDFMHGYIKSYLFAFAIATVCCYMGLSTRGGAEGVGKATTAAVVVSMVMILMLDYFASALLITLGI